MKIVERLLAEIMLLKPSQHSDEVGELSVKDKAGQPFAVIDFYE